jgi:putative two-component system response regulator
MLQQTLIKAGYETIVVSDGLEALNALRNGDCQLVISDWEMPNMTGLELCRAVRGGDFSRYIYIIMLSSHDRPDDALDGLNAGADDFVTKPFNPPELICRIRTGERLLMLETAEMTIFAMAKLAESRDPETGAHLERVRSYCRALAEHLRQTPKYRDRIDDEYVRLIYQTSPLHDIGKVAIPDCVLLKAGRLDEQEFEMMKAHAACGAATLEAAMARYPNARFLKMARDIALTHHEKWNGSGYPNGLAGEDIPLCGRLVALADVYDALTSRRVYKEAFTHATARSIILEDRGGHFDPDVVDAFLASERLFLDIRQRYADYQTMAA